MLNFCDAKSEKKWKNHFQATNKVKTEFEMRKTVRCTNANDSASDMKETTTRWITLRTDAMRKRKKCQCEIKLRRCRCSQSIFSCANIFEWMFSSLECRLHCSEMIRWTESKSIAAMHLPFASSSHFLWTIFHVRSKHIILGLLLLTYVNNDWYSDYVVTLCLLASAMQAAEQNERADKQRNPIRQIKSICKIIVVFSASVFQQSNSKNCVIFCVRENYSLQNWNILCIFKWKVGQVRTDASIYRLCQNFSLIAMHL